MKRKLAVSLEERDAATCIFRLAGDLYGNSSGYDFQEQVRQRFASGTKRVVVDTSGLSRIDSCGIGILASITVSAKNAGCGVVLASLPPKVEQVLSMTWILKCVDHAESVDEALVKLRAMDLSGSGS